MINQNKPTECTCYTCSIPFLTKFIRKFFVYHAEDCALVQEMLKNKKKTLYPQIQEWEYQAWRDNNGI